MDTTDEDAPNAQKREIVFFAKEDARILEETDVMTPARIDPAVYRNIDIRPIGAGTRSAVLFQGEGPDGFSLVTSTMKAGYQLPRHTHSGDCVYLITKGSVFVGRQNHRRFGLSGEKRTAVHLHSRGTRSRTRGVPICHNL